jgi:hypothetical protein
VRIQLNALRFPKYAAEYVAKLVKVSLTPYTMHQLVDKVRRRAPTKVVANTLAAMLRKGDREMAIRWFGNCCNLVSAIKGASAYLL